MKLRLLVSLAGNGWALHAGDAYEADEAEAGRMMASRFAVPWSEAEIETAVLKPAAETRIVGESSPEIFAAKRTRKAK